MQHNPSFMSFDFDVIILGSGPAGFSCAMQASKFDKKVLLIESDPVGLGGAWINSGTVPSKSLREAASVISKYAGDFGRDKRKPYEKFPMAELLRYKKQIQTYENDELLRNLEKNEITIARGRGVVSDANSVSVTSAEGSVSKYTATYLLISTGSKLTVPDHVDIDHKTVIDNVSLLNLDHVPRRLAIVGSGINSVEYATIFASLGSKVTILNEREQFLPFLDHEVHEELDQILFDMGIIIYNSAKVSSVAPNSLRNCNEVRFTLAESDELRVIETEHVLQLGNRKPNTSNIGLEQVGVETNENGYITVDGNYRTNVQSIYAAGDIIGFPGLASVSFSQGRLAACHMFGVPSGEMSPEVPYGIYSIPEISSIGMSEQDAKQAGVDYTVGRAYYRNLAKGSISNNKVGLLKLVFDTKTLKLLGIHIIGEAACDLIHIGQTVMALNGDIRYFVNHVFNYPTYAEGYRIAAFNGLNRVFKTGVKYRNLLES
jgi:NAD(P) transhydrogenase